jgi:hypothetical protein
MRGLIRRAAVVAAAVVALGVPAVAASATQTPVTSWSPTTAPGTYNYGTVNAGQSVSQTFTLANSGGSATSALTITLTGSAAFTKTADSCTGASLGPGKSCTVTVSYAPASAGQTDSGTLTASPASPNKAEAAASLTLQGASATACSEVTVTNPGAQPGTVGTPVSLLIRAACNSASGQTLTYSTGTSLPPGLSIASSTGLISGTPTTLGVYLVTVTATATTGVSGFASFTWTIIPSG